MESNGECTYLKDFDWSARIALSSDKLSTQQKPLLLLSLQTVAASTGRNDDTIIELTSDELLKFIQRLKEAQKAAKDATRNLED